MMQSHHFEVLLSLEPIDEGLDRVVLLLVHFAQALPGIVEVVASNRKISGVTLDLGARS